MEIAQKAPALRDLLTILYKPRETMRRILDAGRDRWTIQVLVLACFCAELSDIDTRHARTVFPNLKLMTLIAIVCLVLVVVALVWVLLLFLLSWIATWVGRLLGGKGTPSDVRAALAWGIVPVIWSVIYRIPVVVYRNQFDVQPEKNVRDVLSSFVAHGGCGFMVVLFALQTICFLGTFIVGSLCVAEAHQFSTDRGFITVAITLALPLMVIFAAVFTMR